VKAAASGRSSCRLVVDANIARSAGDADAVHPRAKVCRDILIGALEAGHALVLTAAIHEEWSRHESVFAKGWRTSMFARRRVAAVDDGAIDGSRFLAALGTAGATEKQVEAAAKDLLLVTAALASDERILSADDRAARLFGIAAASRGELRRLDWAPAADAGTIPWLAQGAPKGAFPLAIPSGAAAPATKTKTKTKTKRG